MSERLLNLLDQINAKKAESKKSGGGRESG